MALLLVCRCHLVATLSGRLSAQQSATWLALLWACGCALVAMPSALQSASWLALLWACGCALVATPSARWSVSQ